MLAKLWGQYQQNIHDARALKVQNEMLKEQIEGEVAKVYHVADTLMTRWDFCPDSPTGFCFTNPDSKNPWVCLYCETDLSMPK